MIKSKLFLAVSTAALMLLASCSGSEGPIGPAGPQGEKGSDGVSITSVIKTGTSGLEDTYTITFSDGTSTTFTVTNGEDGDEGHSPEITINGDGFWCVDGSSLGVRAKGEDGEDGQDGTDGDDGISIVKVEKTSTTELVDTYTITYSNSTTTTFTVVNGADGADGQDGATAWSNTILPVVGGYVVPSIGSGVVGEEITFTAIADDEYTAKALLLNGEQVMLDENSQYTTTMVEHGFVVQGIFAEPNVVPEGADATEIQAFIDSLEAGSTVKFKYDHVLDKRVTLNKDLRIVGDGVVSGIDTGSFGVGQGANVTFQGVKFGTFHNDKNQLSPVYASNLVSAVKFDSCTFEEVDWDAIQLVPVAETASISIINCEFNLGLTQKRAIHIEPKKEAPMDLTKLEIVGNNFVGVSTFGGDLICINRVTNIDAILNLGENEFDGELKLQVPPTYAGNLYIEDSNGIETTFLPDSLISEVSDDKQYFSDEIYLPETGNVTQIATFLEKVPDGSTVVFNKSAELTGNLTINKDLTVKCANEDVVISSNIGSFSVGSENNVVFRNMNFGTFHNDRNTSSVVYGSSMKGSVVFDSCVFGASDWESIQLTPVATASIKITNCVFNISPTQKRAIHIQPGELVDLTELEITGNTFNGADEFGGDIICINNVSNIETIIKVGNNHADAEYVLQTPPSHQGNIYVADNAQGEVRFKVSALSSAEIVTGADAFYYHGELESDPLTADEAYALAEGLGSGGATTEKYYVAGIVTKIADPYTEQYGNITLELTTTEGKVFQLFRVKCTKQEADTIHEGTYVKVHGIIKNYYGAPETDAGGVFVQIENNLTAIDISGKTAITPTEKSIYTATAIPSAASLGTVTWTIESGESYISLPEINIGNTIEVTGVAEGTAVIKATSGNVSSTFSINVSADPVLEPYECTFTKDTKASSYTGTSNQTLGDISWILNGNASIDNYVKLSSGAVNTTADRYICTQTAFSNPVTIFSLETGTIDPAATVNSITLSVHDSAADAASGSNAVESVNAEWVENGIISFSKPETSDWSGKFFRVTFNLSNTTKNKGIIVVGAKVGF